ncbi:MAG: hypothetical protein H6735_11060 [Alphaproteobacteria bacterium]|nr:hypothetical protein [Alphaproteobacteria bacterium]
MIDVPQRRQDLSPPGCVASDVTGVALLLVLLVAEVLVFAACVMGSTVPLGECADAMDLAARNSPLSRTLHGTCITLRSVGWLEVVAMIVAFLTVLFSPWIAHEKPAPR